MSLVFSAIVPHSPILLPTIGKDDLQKLKKTEAALKKLEEDFYLSKPDIVIIISPHGHLLKESFTFNMCAEFTTDLKDFGDLATKLTFKGEMGLPAFIREAAKKENFSVSLISEKNLDVGTIVPLMYLASHESNMLIMPMGFCELDLKTHLEFGYFLKEQIMNSTKRIAIIASSNLSHALSKEAPAGFNPDGKIFDEKIQEFLASGNTAGILQLDADLIKNAHECGLRSILVLLGVMRGINFNYKSYAYEAPFGIGYLTANLVM